jgi:hypothetical protein
MALARQQPVALWASPVWTRHLAALLTLPAFVLLVAAYVPGNAIKARLHHPMVIAVKVWAAAHLLANNTVADLLLFGGFLVWAALSFRAARQRDRLAHTVYAPGRMMPTVAVVLVGGLLGPGRGLPSGPMPPGSGFGPSADRSLRPAAGPPLGGPDGGPHQTPPFPPRRAMVRTDGHAEHGGLHTRRPEMFKLLQRAAPATPETAGRAEDGERGAAAGSTPATSSSAACWCTNTPAWPTLAELLPLATGWTCTCRLAALA